MLLLFSTLFRFRYRKAFVGWKKWVRHEKMETARVNLLSELYFSHPTLFAGMQKVQRELIKLESIQLVRDFDGSTLSLSEFAEANVRSQLNLHPCRTLYRYVAFSARVGCVFRRPPC